MLRRFHVPVLSAGQITLCESDSRHARDVLRLDEGALIEAFDDVGRTAVASIVALSPRVVLQIEAVSENQRNAFELTVAAAVPKGDRADWMIEKLSELGCGRFIPLATDRSVVLPEGKNKHDRWVRIAVESAKQSRRSGVMLIDPLTKLEDALRESGTKLQLSTRPAAQSIASVLSEPFPSRLMLFIGPEGGWSDNEIARFDAANVQSIRLTESILRVETAAIVAAAVVMVASASNRAAGS